MQSNSIETPSRRGILNTTTSADNADGVTLSDETKTLIKCRARLEDLYGDVVTVMSERYGDKGAESEMNNFATAFATMSGELASFIGDFVADNLLDSRYAEM